MYFIQIRMQSDARFCEVLPDKIESIELIVEDLVSQTMKELFGTIIVDDVTVTFVPLDDDTFFSNP
jgi:hypothetical protein